VSFLVNIIDFYFRVNCPMSIHKYCHLWVSCEHLHLRTCYLHFILSARFIIFFHSLFLIRKGIFFSLYLVKPLTFVPKHNFLSFTYVHIGLKSVKLHPSLAEWNPYRTEPSEYLCALTLELWTPGEVIIICINWFESGKYFSCANKESRWHKESLVLSLSFRKGEFLFESFYKFRLWFGNSKFIVIFVNWRSFKTRESRGLFPLIDRSINFPNN
jgi:hypothetical protein